MDLEGTEGSTRLWLVKRSPNFNSHDVELKSTVEGRFRNEVNERHFFNENPRL